MKYTYLETRSHCVNTSFIILVAAVLFFLVSYILIKFMHIFR